ncbi:S1 family peptidase [Rhodoferax sp.]|uniref:S1 family peptidase n=1 Tax=Rhodoferax sp. TaxID=50421 RepID=UPI0039B89CC4
MFSLHDPFGLRKAIVPLFQVLPDGDLQGLGTAFALDPWGSFATADHVVAGIRMRGQHKRSTNDASMRVQLPPGEGLVAVLGFGVAFGTIGLPQETMVRVVEGWSPAFDGGNPMTILRQGHDLRTIDLALLKMQRPGPDLLHNLPIRARPPSPEPGELVVAIGFPTIDAFSGNEEAARTIVSEGMYAAYGRVTQLFPNGRTNPTPVFEVGAKWPSGMSGGPVINVHGEVIGLVSTSDTTDGSEVGCATWLGAFAELPLRAPALDPDNSDFRRGWAAMRNAPWTLAGVYPVEAEACAAAEKAGEAFVVRYGAWRLGSDDFMTV